MGEGERIDSWRHKKTGHCPVFNTAEEMKKIGYIFSIVSMPSKSSPVSSVRATA
jgi:hypothetical protein